MRSKKRSHLHEILQFAQHLVNFLGIVHEVFSCIYHQHFLSWVALKPFLVQIINKFQVLSWDLALF